MATNNDRTELAQQIVVQCSCGKRMLALTQHVGKRVKCSACGHAIVVTPQDEDQPRTTEQPEGTSRAGIIAAWSFVGVFAIGSFVFLNLYSRSLDQAAVVAANEAKAIAERDMQARQDHEQQLRRIANANVETLFGEAIEALEADDITTSQRKVEEALAVRHADAALHVKKLDEQIKNTTDPARIHETLMGLSDENFQQLRENGTMPQQLLTNYLALNRRAVELVKADIERVAEIRDAPRLAKLEKERAELEKERQREKEELAKLQEREKQQRENEVRIAAREEEARKKAKPQPVAPSPLPKKPYMNIGPWVDFDDFKVGAMGCPEGGRDLGTDVKIIQIVDDNRMLIQIRDSRTLERSMILMLKHSTKGLVDGKYVGSWGKLIGEHRVIHIPDTVRYNTVGGATRTVLLVEVVPIAEP